MFASLLWLAACGPLADADYPGEVLFTLRGNVLTSEGQDYRDESLRVSLFWVSGDDAVEEQAVGMTTAFPARYTLELYAYPPTEALGAAGWQDRDVAVGMPLLYLDETNDGRWDPHEPIVGGSPEEVVLYADGLDDDDLDGVRDGFQRMYSSAHGVACGGMPVGDFEAMWPAEEQSTDLIVGEWWEELKDWDCDEDFDEWDALCPDGDELQDWCVEQLTGDPYAPYEREGDEEACLELCFEPRETTTAP